MVNERESARGEVYSIAENTIQEYAAWYNMPWEDYWTEQTASPDRMKLAGYRLGPNRIGLHLAGR